MSFSKQKKAISITHAHTRAYARVHVCVCVCACVSTIKLFYTWGIINIMGRTKHKHTHPEACTVMPRPVVCNSRVLRS